MQVPDYVIALQFGFGVACIRGFFNRGQTPYKQKYVSYQKSSYNQSHIASNIRHSRQIIISPHLPKVMRAFNQLLTQFSQNQIESNNADLNKLLPKFSQFISVENSELIGFYVSKTLNCIDLNQQLRIQYIQFIKQIINNSNGSQTGFEPNEFTQVGIQFVSGLHLGGFILLQTENELKQKILKLSLYQIQENEIDMLNELSKEEIMDIVRGDSERILPNEEFLEQIGWKYIKVKQFGGYEAVFQNPLKFIEFAPEDVEMTIETNEDGEIPQTVVIIGEDHISLQKMKYSAVMEKFADKAEMMEVLVILSLNCDLQTQKRIIRSEITPQVCQLLLIAHYQIYIQLEEEDIQILWQKSTEWRTIELLDQFAAVIIENEFKTLFKQMCLEWLHSDQLKQSQIFQYLTNEYNENFTPQFLQFICDEVLYEQFIIILKQTTQIESNDITPITPTKITQKDQKNIEQIVGSVHSYGLMYALDLVKQIFRFIQYDIVNVIVELRNNEIIFTKEQLTELKSLLTTYLRYNCKSLSNLLNTELDTTTIFIWCLALCDKEIVNKRFTVELTDELVEALYKLKQEQLLNQDIIDVIHSLCLGQTNFFGKYQFQKQEMVYYDVKIADIINKLNDTYLMNVLYFSHSTEIALPQYATFKAVELIINEKLNFIPDIYQIVNNSTIQFTNDFMNKISIQQSIQISSIIQSDIVNKSILNRMNDFDESDWLLLESLTPQAGSNKVIHNGGYQVSKTIDLSTKTLTVSTQFNVQDSKDCQILTINLQDGDISLQQLDNNIIIKLTINGKQKEEYFINIQQLISKQCYNSIQIIVDCKKLLGITIILEEKVRFSGIYPVKNQSIQSFSIFQEALFQSVNYVNYCVPLSVLRQNNLQQQDTEVQKLSDVEEFTFASSAVPYSLYIFNKPTDYQTTSQNIEKIITLQSDELYTNNKQLKELYSMYQEAILSYRPLSIQIEKKSQIEKSPCNIQQTCKSFDIRFANEKIIDIIEKQPKYQICQQDQLLVGVDIQNSKQIQSDFINIKLNNKQFSQKVIFDPKVLLQFFQNVNISNKQHVMQFIISNIFNSSLDESSKVQLLHQTINQNNQYLSECVEYIFQQQQRYLHLLLSLDNYELNEQIFYVLSTQISSISTQQQLEKVLLAYDDCKTLNLLLQKFDTFVSNSEYTTLIEALIFLVGKPQDFQILIQNKQSEMLLSLIQHYYKTSNNVISNIDHKIIQQYIKQSLDCAQNMIIEQSIIFLSSQLDIAAFKLMIWVLNRDSIDNQMKTQIFYKLSLKLEQSQYTENHESFFENVLQYISSNQEFFQLYLIFERYVKNMDIIHENNIIFEEVPFEIQIATQFNNWSNNYQINPVQNSMQNPISQETQISSNKNNKVILLYLEKFDHGFQYNINMEKELSKVLFTASDLCLILQIKQLNNQPSEKLIKIVANHFTELIQLSNVNLAPTQFFTLLYAYNQSNTSNTQILLQVIKQFIKNDNISVLDKRSNFTALHNDLQLCQTKNLIFFTSLFKYIWIQVSKNLQNNERNKELEDAFILLASKIGLKYINVRKYFALMFVSVTQLIPFSDFCQSLLELSLTFDWQQDKKWTLATKVGNKYKQVLNEILLKIENYQETEFSLETENASKQDTEIDNIIYEDTAEKEIDFEIFIFIASIWQLYYAQQNQESSQNQIVESYAKQFTDGNANKILTYPFQKNQNVEVTQQSKYFNIFNDSLRVISKVWIQLGNSIIQAEQLYYDKINAQLKIAINLQIEQSDKHVVDKNILSQLNNIISRNLLKFNINSELQHKLETGK
ncbi:Hypothetical_protein [Hexamita inflata]|uniref:Hypothetical_protein n=1 Tax=Hexamita inflata TaxID=28002 RepID=A0AA86UMR4_9EUKA|nr:Hypothetical protein HINF_LOCUS32035 [Hexamita inflata]CAI9964435.1 Hypothetical protein HINF_LOCUS52080 [Hexamita inflata]